MRKEGSFTEEVEIQKNREWRSTVSRATEKLGRMAHKRPLDLRIRSLLMIDPSEPTIDN